MDAVEKWIIPGSSSVSARGLNRTSGLSVHFHCEVALDQEGLEGGPCFAAGNGENAASAPDSTQVQLLSFTIAPDVLGNAGTNLPDVQDASIR